MDDARSADVGIIMEGIVARGLVSVIDSTGTPAAAIATRDGVWSHPRLAGHRDVLAVVRDWAEIGRDVSAILADADLDGAQPLGHGRTAQLLSYPSKILCSGPNFTDHLAEMGESDLGAGWTPYFFLKPPSTVLRRSGQPFELGSVEDRVDWEGELAAVIGVGGRDIPVAAALDHVAGYTVANDISLRRPHRRDTPAAPFQWDWVASKAADGSLPLGPGLVPAALVEDPQDLAIRTRVNGVLHQDGTTANMVFGVAELVAHASRLMTLEPGDVLVTGTPAGVGAGRGTFLRPGDVVTVSIPSIGTLTTPITQRRSE